MLTYFSGSVMSAMLTYFAIDTPRRPLAQLPFRVLREAFMANGVPGPGAGKKAGTARGGNR
jgi:hypothetical protein